MANMRRARKGAARARRKQPKQDEAFREAVFGPAFDMEEPLREAQHLIHVIGAIEPYRGEDNEAVGFVAVEANRKLEVVHRLLHRILAAFRIETQRQRAS